MEYAKKLISNILSATGGTWVTKSQVLAYQKQYGGAFSDFQASVGDDICEWEEKYTTKELAKLESNVAINVMRLVYVRDRSKYDENVIRSHIATYEKKENISLHETQKQAVVKVINNPFCLLIGGPGTGKTTVCKCIIYVKRQLKKHHCSIVLTAPTGKAANRLAESTGENTCTLHKKVLSGMPIYEDTLFVDESSMIDLELADKLFNLMLDGHELVLIGDTEQLPSVGAGCVLRDLIESEVIPVARLSKTFRQSDGSVLFQTITNIKNGLPEIPSGDDIHPIEINDDLSDVAAKGQAAQEGTSAYLKAVEKYGKENVAFLVPYRKRGFCSDFLNPILQKLCNHSTCGYKYQNQIFKKDDLVIQLENRAECANGDVGEIIKVDETGITVQFSGAQVKYTPETMGQISLAYSMSIHKSQGSEYKHVVVVLLNQHETMLQRNLIYTGITRAKKECTVIYQKKALAKACATKADSSRITFLADKLRMLDEQYRAVYG